jgi:uncharacterized spore protein YtfJ
MSVNTMEATSASEILESMEGVRDSLTVGRVFGDPIEADGVQVIPVARVRGGAGGGGGESKDADEPGSGFGSGFGMDARPVGVYEIHDGAVEWKPAIDVTRLAKGGQAIAALCIICFTLVMLRRSR